MNATIHKRVASILSDELGANESTITQELRLVSDLGADSLDLIEIVVCVEDEFKIKISDAEAEACATVADLCAIIQRKGGAA